MQQTIGIPMGIDPVPFWANLFLYTYEQDYMNIQMRDSNNYQSSAIQANDSSLDLA